MYNTNAKWQVCIVVYMTLDSEQCFDLPGLITMFSGLHCTDIRFAIFLVNLMKNACEIATLFLTHVIVSKVL